MGMAKNVELCLQYLPDQWGTKRIFLTDPAGVLGIQNVVISLAGDEGEDSIFNQFRVDPDRTSYRQSTNTYEVFVDWVPGQPTLSDEEIISELLRNDWKLDI